MDDLRRSGTGKGSMASYRARWLVSKALIQDNPAMLGAVEKLLLEKLMAAVNAEVLLGEIIVSLGRIEQWPDDDLAAIRFEQIVNILHLVRCRDCKHWSDGYCRHTSLYKPENWFCADGENKDGGRVE